MRWARWIFALAGLTGLLALVPMLFLEERLGRMLPPPIAQPVYYYGFVGVAIVWQVAFLLIATDPARYRPLMLVGILEKLSFGAPTLILRDQGRVPDPLVAAAAFDLTLGALFLVAWLASRPHPTSPREPGLGS